MINSVLKIAKVNPEGLEPSTYSLEGYCSIQLSYGSFLFLGGKGKKKSEKR